MRLVIIVVTLFTSSLVSSESTSRSLSTVVQARVRFMPFSTSLPGQQMTTRSRMKCLSACLGTVHCQTVSFVASQQACYLFADPPCNGQLIADPSADTILVSVRNPVILRSPTHSLLLTIPSNTYPVSIFIADVDKDNKLDLIVAEYHGHHGHLFMGDGTGNFNPDMTFYTGGHPSSVAGGYFDNDTNPDVVSISFDYGFVTVFYGRGTTSFDTRYFYSDSHQKQCVVVGDFNGDNHLDFVVALNQNNTVTLHLANGTGGFIVKHGFGTGTTPYAMASGIFNSDNYTDLAVTNAGSASVSILLGRADGTFENEIRFPVRAFPIAIAAGKLNADNYTDLIIANRDDDSISVLLGNGNGSFGTAKTFCVGYTQPLSIAIADMNGDGILDAVIGFANNDNSKLAVLRGRNDGTFDLQGPFLATGRVPKAVAIGDFNGDNRPDVVVANADSNMLSIFTNIL